MNQQSPPWLTQAKYRAAIHHLLRCMQTRGQPLKLRHILSHMEHTHTDDAELARLRDRLAEVDSIATTTGEGDTHVPLITPLSHCSDDFHILVESFYSDDKVKTLLDRLGASLRATRLATYKMEGFLQRSVTTPNWTLSTDRL
jgi:hypothetical protein